MPWAITFNIPIIMEMKDNRLNHLDNFFKVQLSSHSVKFNFKYCPGF